jgi:hypothetical protein
MTSTTEIVAALLALGIVVAPRSWCIIDGFIKGASGREYRVTVNPGSVILHACNHPTMGYGFEAGRAILPTTEKLSALLAKAV